MPVVQHPRGNLSDRWYSLLSISWSDGTTHLLFTPCEFIEKLTALIPPPRLHLVRWSGVFAPNSPYRKLIILKPEVKKGFQFDSNEESKLVKKGLWSKMLARVFKIDVSTCEHCGGVMKIISAIIHPDSVKSYLPSLNIDHIPPPRAPPCFVQPTFAFL